MHELAIAKRFDKDGDGILNDKEKANCLNALENGYENTLYFAKDTNDPKLNLRVIQKGGKILLPDAVHDYSRSKSSARPNNRNNEILFLKKEAQNSTNSNAILKNFG